MRLALVGLIAVTLAACDLKTAFTGNVEVVARAGELELHRDTLAAILADGKWTPEEGLAEVLAFRWVEYALAGQRFAQGDSLLDSAMVYHAMWADASQWLVDYYHDSVLVADVAMDSAAVESTYQAGEHRLIYHILIRTRPDMTPPERRVARVNATRIRNLLGRGITWEEANEQNEDPVAKRAGGSLGLLRRGAAAAEFEEAAFGLQPGGISDVVETQYGFHVIWRPVLSQVWDEYRDAIEQDRLAAREDEFLAEMDERWEVRVRSNAPDAMREAISSPLQMIESRRVIGDYRGGRFMSADFVRWLRVLPASVSQSVGSATDEQLMELAGMLIRREVLVLEARESGVSFREGDLEDLRGRLREELDMLRYGLQLDSVLEDVPPGPERVTAVSDAIIEYYRLSADNRSQAVVVPALVADRLREEMEWEISVAGIDQALERARAIRAEMSALADSSASPADSNAGDGDPND